MLLAIACFALALVAGACGSSDTNSNANSSTTNNSNAGTKSSPPATTSTPAAATSTASGDKIGVPECDDYLAKYEACVTGKVPEQARAQFKSSLETTRKSWRDMAANPQTKAGLAAACKMATDSAKTSMSSYGCTW